MQLVLLFDLHKLKATNKIIQRYTAQSRVSNEKIFCYCHLRYARTSSDSSNLTTTHYWRTACNISCKIFIIFPVSKRYAKQQSFIGDILLHFSTCTSKRENISFLKIKSNLIFLKYSKLFDISCLHKTATFNVLQEKYFICFTTHKLQLCKLQLLTLFILFLFS